MEPLRPLINRLMPLIKLMPSINRSRPLIHRLKQVISRCRLLINRFMLFITQQMQNECQTHPTHGRGSKGLSGCFTSTGSCKALAQDFRQTWARLVPDLHQTLQTLPHICTSDGVQKMRFGCTLFSWWIDAQEINTESLITRYPIWKEWHINITMIKFRT